MKRQRARWRGIVGPAFFVLGLASCAGAESTQALERIEAKLDQIDSRLNAQEERLDALAADVNTTAQWATAAAAKEEAIAAKEAAIAARMAAREARRAEVREHVSARETASLGRGPIEGAEEAIQCVDHELPRWRCTMDPTFVDTVLANPTLFATQARVVPAIRDEVMSGFKLYGIRPGSLPKLLGFKNGDTIVSMDGNPMGSLDQAMEAYVSLRGAKKVEIELLRKGTPAWLTVEFAAVK